MHQPLTLATLKGGAAIEAVDALLLDVWENVMDPNTKATAQRKVVLEVIFTPDKDREVGIVQIKPTAKLAPQAPIDAKVGFGRDENGLATAAEYGAFNPNQHLLPGTTEDAEENDERPEMETADNVTPLKRAQGAN